MIKGFFEIYIFVKNLDCFIDFYIKNLGLELCYFEKERCVVFFWIGKFKEYMLGLWEKFKK